MPTVTADSLRAGAELDVTLGYSLGTDPKPLVPHSLDDAPCRCRMRIYRPTTGLLAVVFSEQPDNDGMTITNAGERLASMALNRYVLSCDWPHTMFFQHYPPAWFEKYPLRLHAGAEHWTEEIHHFQPVLRYNTIVQCWMPNPAGDTTWHSLAKLYGCRIAVNDKLYLGQYSPAMYALAAWLAGRDVDLLTPNIATLATRHGVNTLMPGEAVL